ncbi:helix-turn-helix domain-containing protein [Streptomyces avicenniae]|uniref:helix-turn-helix domain-containing protein n=1 Tax=Streptomyces avicenniae TaxID=500153 RepID=UPI000699CF23|nr:helix-turn-helix domain-containing protein [Streptomyces avicenniae]
MSDEGLTGIAAATADRDPLVALAAMARLRAELERAEAVLVRRARNEGATWPQIAAALGVSKQAVHKKHSGRGLLGGRS